MKKNMLIRILSLVCVLACLFAFASCHDDLATKEELSNAENTSKASLEEAQTALNAAIADVKATADAAATKAALDEVSALLNSVKDTADAAATAEALNSALATLDEVKNTITTLAVKETVDAAIKKVKDIADAAATQTALEQAIADAEKNNTDLKTELEATINANKTAVEEAIAELATKVELKEVSDLLATVKGTADAAATKTALDDAVKALEGKLAEANEKIGDNATDVAANAAEIAKINEALKTLANADTLTAVSNKLDELAKNAATKAELTTEISNLEKKVNDGIGKNLTELTTKVGELETKVNTDITNINTEIKNIKDALGAVSGDPAAIEALTTKLTALENTVNGINVNGFKDAYVALTEKLLSEDYEYAYSKFVAIVLDIDEGPYDPDEAKAVRLRAEDILFAVTRAVSEDGLADLYNELVEIKTNLKTLEESLTERVNAITYINTSAECIEAVKAADKLYEKMVALEIEFVNPDLKAQYLEIWNAYIELHGGTTKDETESFDGYKNIAKKNIDDVVATILNRDVKLNGTDGETIEKYEAAINALKDAIDHSQHRELYEAGLATEVVDAVKAEIIAEKTAANILAGEANNLTSYTKNYRDAYIASILEACVAEAKTALVNAAIEEKKAELMGANAELSEEDALAQATAAVNADADLLASIDAQAAVDGKADAEAKANETENANKFVADAKAQIAQEAADKANADAATDAGKKEIFVRAMAESLFNEDAAEAVSERYENMTKAATDAAAALVNEVLTVIREWDNNGLLYNDTTAAAAYAKIGEWVENAAYKSTNEAYIAAYAFSDDDVSTTNRDYVFGNYNNTTVTNFAQLTNVMKYVAALKEVYDSYAFADVEATGVEAYIEVLKAAINGVDVEGKVVLDVDAVAIDNCKKALEALDAAILVAANNNTTAAGKNQLAMVGEVARNRFTVIETAESKLAAIIIEIKTKYCPNGTWSVTDINAADDLDAFRARIDAEYNTVRSNSTAPDYVIYNVTSTLAEEAYNSAVAAFNKYTEFAAQKYLEAKALIDELEALGAVKLNHGKRIYEVSVSLKSLSTVITGMTYETRFPVDADNDGTFEMVDFYDLQEKINNKYVPEYKALALEAEAKAAELEAEIAELLAAVIVKVDEEDVDNSNKLDHYKAITELMARVETEWLNAFYSDDMLAAENADDDTVMVAIKAAVAATTDTKIIGKNGVTYAFLKNETYASLEAITKTANKTYAEVKALAEQWIKDAKALVNDNKYTFHDWDKTEEGAIDFVSVHERYVSITTTYYLAFAVVNGEITEVVDPDFDLYANHEVFHAEYVKCEEMAREAKNKIEAIENAIVALGELNTITLDNSVEKRAAVDAILTLIAEFEDGYCDKAQEDGDIDAELLFTLAKHNALVEVVEYWLSREAEWPTTWNAEESLNVAIESIDSAIADAVEFGIDRYTALNNFLTTEKSTVDKEISNAATPAA